ncbi:MAG TPA: Ig-like domain-containing protein [Rhodocyclaceae bacterium]|nr:Ig-like domain-containing protein [Rhodocyclaceae bacterium]
MNRFESVTRPLMWLMALLLVAVAAGCGGGGGGRDPILGVGGIVAVAPTVTAVAPVSNASGVPINNTIITANFSEPMAPLTGGASFTVTCTTAPCVNPSGTVALDASNRIATYTLTPGSALMPLSDYTATVTGAKSIATGLALASPYVWHFKTGVALDTTRPGVTLTVPATTIPGPTSGVPTNTAISAVFTEDMAPATITAASFTLSCTTPCTAPAGSVSYAVGSRTAVFTPATALAVSTTYTATITTAATDLAGNQLAGNQAPLPAASNYVSAFSTAATAVPAANVSVLSTNPATNAINVSPNATVNATFTVPASLRMDPLSVTTASFTVTGPAPALTPVTAASVVIDGATGHIASFTPASALAVGVYTATIKGGASGVKDLAIPADTMLNDYTWSFTVAAAIPPPPPPQSHLGSASTFGIMATSAITNTGAATMINGDVALEPGTSNGLLPVQVNGTIHINDTVSHQANIDLLAAYNYYKGLPPGTTITGGADLGALYPNGIPPGTYTSGSTMLVSTPLVLDANGDANAVWVFQIGSSLTTNTPLGNVTLLNGAQAKNVFWVPTSDATVGVGTTFNGTIVAGRDATAQTGATINGRVLAGAITAGTIALDTNTVTVPAP